ncbi:hypothetical protein EW145_g7140 [Phellinidium pouzarii]|uniref:GINS subunit domain-containing protein n=1 Tax=Phellinidium pouzarii TaxID=167371 RepID=A0A4S4KNE2_9AGAM|nr:hypothetical protein EW145_g7140 [Phellinidium pouzarii]
MSSIDDLRSKFYDDAHTSPRSSAVPYPHPRDRSARSAPAASSSRRGANGNKNARSRAAPAPSDDPSGGDPLGGLGLNPPNRDMGMGMDVDVDTRSSLLTRAQHSRSALESDVQRLTRAWQDERHAPDILPARDVLLGRVLDALRRQTSDANALRTADALSEEDHYMTMLVQTEVERVKFIVRSYVRTRLFKIEQYPAYITSNTDVQARLTHAELRHAQRYAVLLVAQFRTTVLDHLPPTQQALDDEVLTMPSMSCVLSFFVRLRLRLRSPSSIP